MEALCFAPSQQSVLRPKFSNPIKPPINGTFNNIKFRPLIFATLSKSTAEISPLPTVASRETSSNGAPLTAPLLSVSPDSLERPAGYLVTAPERAAAADGGNGGVNSMEYLTNILTSKVYDVAIESPLQLAPKLSERVGVNVWLKREDLQPVSHLYSVKSVIDV